MLSGFSDNVSVTTSGTNVNLDGFDPFMYEVLITSYTAGITGYVTKNSNGFTITSIGGDGEFVYLIIPKCGLAF